MATAPVARSHWVSVSGVQLRPLFVLRHTPPVAVAMYIGPLGVMGGAIAAIRPKYRPPTVRKKPPAASQKPFGPRDRHDPVSGVVPTPERKDPASCVRAWCMRAIAAYGISSKGYARCAQYQAWRPSTSSRSTCCAAASLAPGRSATAAASVSHDRGGVIGTPS